MEKKTNLDMLLWGIKHIAKNHGLKANTDYEEEGQICIYGGCNVPTLADVQMLCGDVGISERCVYASREGIDIEILPDWFEKAANKIYTGLGFWQRRNWL